MAVGGRAPMARVVLHRGNDTVLLRALYPRLHQSPYSFGIVAQAAGLDDGVLWLDVEIGDRGVDPVDPDATCFPRRHLATLARDLLVIQESQRGRGGQVGQAIELLAPAPLEIRSDEQWVRGGGLELRGEVAGGVRCAAENDIATHAQLERGIDARLFVAVPGLRMPAQRGKDQSREAVHAGVMRPSIRGPFAPVAEGTFPGRFSVVSQPISAKATASFASPSKKTSLKCRMVQFGSMSLSWFTSVTFLAPPPEISSSLRPVCGSHLVS